MSDIDLGDVYRLRALGVRPDLSINRPPSDLLMKIMVNALHIANDDCRRAAAKAAKWKLRFWLCAALSALQLAAIAVLLKGGGL